MFIALLFALFMVYEIQSLVQFRFFFKMLNLVADHYTRIISRPISKINISMSKIIIAEFVYIIILIIAVFGINSIGALIILLLALVGGNIVKRVKNIKVRKVWFIFDKIVSILILFMMVLNFYFFDINTLEILKNIF